MPKLTKTQQADALRARGIYNVSRLVSEVHGGGGVCVLWQSAHSVIPGRAAVARPGYKTDPKAAWYDYGCKTFLPFGRDQNKRTAIEEAKAWASKKYGVAEWERTPFDVNEWVPKGTVEAALALPVREA